MAASSSFLPAAIDYIAGDDTVWEQRAAGDAGQRRPARRVSPHGFWQNMDTLRDKHVLEGFWESGEAQWKIW